MHKDFKANCFLLLTRQMTAFLWQTFTKRATSGQQQLLNCSVGPAKLLMLVSVCESDHLSVVQPLPSVFVGLSISSDVFASLHLVRENMLVLCVRARRRIKGFLWVQACKGAHLCFKMSRYAVAWMLLKSLVIEKKMKIIHKLHLV